MQYEEFDISKIEDGTKRRMLELIDKEYRKLMWDVFIKDEKIEYDVSNENAKSANLYVTRGGGGAVYPYQTCTEPKCVSSVVELKRLAKERGLKGFHTLRKQQLIELLNTSSEGYRNI